MSRKGSARSAPFSTIEMNPSCEVMNKRASPAWAIEVGRARPVSARCGVRGIAGGEAGSKTSDPVAMAGAPCADSWADRNKQSGTTSQRDGDPYFMPWTPLGNSQPFGKSQHATASCPDAMTSTDRDTMSRHDRNRRWPDDSRRGGHLRDLAERRSGRAEREQAGDAGHPAFRPPGVGCLERGAEGPAERASGHADHPGRIPAGHLAEAPHPGGEPRGRGRALRRAPARRAARRGAAQADEDPQSRQAAAGRGQAATRTEKEGTDRADRGGVGSRRRPRETPMPISKLFTDADFAAGGAGGAEAGAGPSARWRP